jgi:hypothetical protein
LASAALSEAPEPTVTRAATASQITVPLLPLRVLSQWWLAVVEMLLHSPASTMRFATVC